MFLLQFLFKIVLRKSNTGQNLVEMKDIRIKYVRMDRE